MRSREELVFKVVTAGLYRSFNGKEIIVNNTGENRLQFEFVSWFSIYFYSIKFSISTLHMSHVPQVISV